MIVRCPSCKTAYRVTEEIAQDTMPLFRCSRCKHTFELEPADTPQHSARNTYPSEKLSGKTQVEEELSFTFPPKELEDPKERKETIDSATQDHPSSATRGASEKTWSMSASESTFDGRFIAPDSHIGERNKVIDPAEDIPHQVSPSQSLPLSREATDNILALDPYRDQHASIVPYLSLFGLLLLVFAFVTALYVAHPETSEVMVKTIPWVGRFVLKNHHLKNGVALQSLQASRQTIQGNREVFVVTGVVQNQNPVVIREVRVAGQLYNLAGKEIERQTIWIGNAISPRIIRAMTVQDISDLQRLKPLKTFEIPPGDSIPFTIVFLKSTKGVTDFSCAVLAAEEQA